MIRHPACPASVRSWIGCFALLASVCIGLNPFATATAYDRTDAVKDYTKLLDYIGLEDREDPLVAFSRGEDGVDAALNRENVDHINENQQLLDRIRARLESDDLQWRLGNASKRRMIVPEDRPEYAELFESYCNDVVRYVLDRLELPNPYRAIATLNAPPDGLDAPAEEGIRAYLVHNVAEEYMEEYIFSDISGEGKQVKIRLRNRTYGGVVGSYTSNMVIGENQQFRFVHEPYTLWQNSAKNPLNVFIEPIEETLHIALRESTEAAILAAILAQNAQTLQEVEAIIEECMAVEEAVVGGLVTRLLPEVFERYLPNPPADHLNRILEERKALGKYRYLERGITVVADLGLSEAIAFYRSNVAGFKAMLAPSPEPDVAQEPILPTLPAGDETQA